MPQILIGELGNVLSWVLRFNLSGSTEKIAIIVILRPSAGIGGGNYE